MAILPALDRVNYVSNTESGRAVNSLGLGKTSSKELTHAESQLSPHEETDLHPNSVN